MAANSILPFAQGGGANVQTQVDYAADAQRPLGNQPGTARASFVNKALLQLSAISVGVAQFLADYQGTDVTDALTGASLSTMMKNALNATGLFTTQSPGNNSTRPATTAYVDAAVSGATAAGLVAFFPGNPPGSGWLNLNGQVVSRATYAALYAYAAASGNIVSDATWLGGAFGSFSSGDGATTFRLPDSRGYHLRSWDNGRGVDSGRTLGSVQADAVLSHNHTVNLSYADLGHLHNTGITQFLGAGGGDNSNYGASSGSALYTGTSYANLSISATTVAVGAAENRVKNIAWANAVKY